MDKAALEREAISIVNQHLNAYKEPQVFITENVSFSIKPLIRLLRKNYYGVFETPKDKSTGRKKTWVPVTMSMCDGVTKNSDIDTKDATFTSRKRRGIAVTEITRATIRRELEDTYFGQDLDMAIRTLSIDPTLVWMLEDYKEAGKTHVKRTQIDVLNCYIDPSASSLQDVDFAVRFPMTKEEMREHTEWKDVDKAVENENVPRYDNLSAGFTNNTKLVEVFRFHGMVPEYLITGKKKDKKKVPVEIITSGTGDAATLHYIGRNTKKDKMGNSLKPYEEGWYTKLPWSWYGISPAWKVLDIQEYINQVVNIRINRNTVAQYGLFKMKQGSGIKQRDFARLGSNGVIKVRDMNDLEQFQVQEAGAGSYKDEEVAKQWAAEVTSAFDIVRGAPGPASATATGQAIENANSKTAFLLIKDSIGYFLQKVIDRHYLPLVPKMVKEQGPVRIYGDIDNIEDLRERVTSWLVIQELEKSPTVPTEEDFELAYESIARQLRQDKDLFLENLEDIMVADIDTRVQFTNEEMDINIISRNLIDMMRVVPPEMQIEMINQVFDMFGLERPRGLRATPQQPQQALQAIPSDIASVQNVTTDAVTGIQA